jgi:hypothetical protein
MQRLKPFVIIESPYAGDVERNLKYAKRCLKDSLDRGEAPFASHLLYTQVLDDNIVFLEHVQAGYTIMLSADIVAFYEDYGFSPGMTEAIEIARIASIPTEYRKIGTNEP